MGSIRGDDAHCHCFSGRTRQNKRRQFNVFCLFCRSFPDAEVLNMSIATFLSWFYRVMFLHEPRALVLQQHDADITCYCPPQSFVEFEVWRTNLGNISTLQGWLWSQRRWPETPIWEFKFYRVKLGVEKSSTSTSGYFVVSKKQFERGL